MVKLINNILLPLDLDHHPSEQVVEQVVQLANRFQSDLHILLVDDNSLVPQVAEGKIFGSRKNGNKNGHTEAWLKENFTHLLEDHLSFLVSTSSGHAEQMILEYSIKYKVDLVVIGKSNRTILGGLFHTISINRLARKTQSAILVVHEKPALQQIKNIVLPVHEHLPVRKIMFASYLARAFSSKIHLIALTPRYPRNTVEETLYLSKTYQLLRENTNLAIECQTIPGENIADATMEYARQVKADLIVVNPGKELLLSGFINRLFARFITSESKIPVMTIGPTSSLE